MNINFHQNFERKKIFLLENFTYGLFTTLGYNLPCTEYYIQYMEFIIRKIYIGDIRADF